MDIPYTLVNIEEADLSPYKIILTPRAVFLGDDYVVRLRRFAASGGRIVASQQAGKLNNRGEERSYNPFESQKNIAYTEEEPDWKSIISDSK